MPGDLNMNATDIHFNKTILIAVDESENAHRAVSYVGQLLGGSAGFDILLLHIILDPEEDYFSNREDKQRWLNQHRQKIEVLLNNYRNMLIRAGFSKDAVKDRCVLQYRSSAAECILAEGDKNGCSAIVVGRQGLTGSNDFFLGGLSSKIITHAKNCTIWVVG